MALPEGPGGCLALENALPIAPAGFRLFNVRVHRKAALSPSLIRITFFGDDVAHMRVGGPDQSIRILFPDPFGRAPDLPAGPDWLDAWRALPAQGRPPQRLFTLRALRRRSCEFDVDFHSPAELGPASTWARTASRGEALQVVAPARSRERDCGGYEWRPPRAPERLLLMADQSALPALTAILETLAVRAAPPPTEVFIEGPEGADRLELPSWRQQRVKWMARNGAPHGARLMESASCATLPPASAAVSVPAPEVDVDRTVLWERAARRDSGFYAWVAGEAGAVKEVRRVLVERGLDRCALTALGYWRRGRVLDPARA
ncbi:MAG: siderophore-interacting protein [Hyphomonadaceae bacterium]|nr:siderophore-interacting protein [Hyphomonadaceae bacterium]